MAKKNNTARNIALVGAGALALWLLTRQSAQAQSAKIGQILINTDNQRVYVLGTDLKIHQILDPSILTSRQLSDSLRVNTSAINTFEEGAAFVCL